MLNLLLVVLIPGWSDASPPSVAKIEQAALDARLDIRTAYVKLRYETVNHSKPEWNQIGVRTLWFDGKKIRGEVIREKGPNVGNRFVNCFNCEKEGYGINWVDLPDMVASLHAIGAKGKPQFMDALDPRLLGYYVMPVEFLRPGTARLDAVVGSTDRDEPTVTREQLHGTDCWVLRWTAKSGTVVTVWIAPTKGNNVVRIKQVLAHKMGTDAITRTLDSDVVPVGKSGLWFPRLVVYEESAGEKVLRRQTVDIQEVKLNEPIDPTTFTFAALPEGTWVEMPDPKQSGYVRNGRIDTNRPTTHFQDTTPAEEPTPVNPPSGRMNHWLIAACAACVLAAVAVLIVRRGKSAT